jgi:hypothetical protein
VKEIESLDLPLAAGSSETAYEHKQGVSQVVPDIGYVFILGVILNIGGYGYLCEAS